MKKTFIKGNVFVEGNIILKNYGDIIALSTKKPNKNNNIIEEDLKIEGDLIVDNEIFYVSKDVYAFYKV